MTKAQKLLRALDKDKPGKCPDMLPKDFVADAIALQRMHAHDDVACSVHGREWQDNMAEKYPIEWMLWLRDEMNGYFSDD